MDKLDWNSVDMDALPKETRDLVIKVHEAETAATAAKAKASEALSALIKGTEYEPKEGTEVVWAYRFQSVSFAYRKKQAKSGKSKITLGGKTPPRSGFRTKK